MDVGHSQLLISQAFFFFCLTIIFRMVTEAILRYRILKEGISETLLTQTARIERARQRASALRWGTFLTGIGLGFGLLAALGWNRLEPGSFAIILVMAGLSQLVYHRLSRNEP